MSPRRAAVVALSLLPSALAGIAFEGAIERRLGGPRSIAAGLVAGGVVMAIADSRASMGGAGAARGREDAGPGDGLALGLAQAAALMPGVSRSGATRAAARARGFGRSAAQALSWHAGLPVLLGVGIARGMSLRRRGVAIEQRTAMAVGAASAFLSTRASAAFATQRGRAESSLMPYVIYRCLLTGLIVQRLRRQAAANASQTYK